MDMQYMLKIKSGQVGTAQLYIRCSVDHYHYTKKGDQFFSIYRRGVRFLKIYKGRRRIEEVGNHCINMMLQISFSFSVIISIRPRISFIGLPSIGIFSSFNIFEIEITFHHDQIVVTVYISTRITPTIFDLGLNTHLIPIKRSVWREALCFLSRLSFLLHESIDLFDYYFIESNVGSAPTTTFINKAQY
ncbi:hypothetical protein AGLY_014216 [Aphis glycines]|uniref:Uncharacterized protein n=1 Tax=Aphis glycines TaxID=307491 RepID=A0A6G0T536_APHGL|nr:hypothetical protein AGLY_014216 [Aphis glycines]